LPGVLKKKVNNGTYSVHIGYLRFNDEEWLNSSSFDLSLLYQLYYSIVCQEAIYVS